MRSIPELQRDPSTGLPPGEARDGRIKIHGEEAFEGMRRAGQLAARTLDFIAPYVRPGITTGELDRLCLEFTLDHNAIPAPLNYRGFPKSICTSINHVVCHGIPGERRLAEGDIVNIDVTPILDGWHGNSSRMFFVGERIPVKARRLVDVTYEAMMRSLAAIRPGLHLGVIGDAIQRYAESHRFSVVRDFCGHGVGRIFHDAPSVLHYGHPEDGPVMREGMIFHRRADDQRRPVGGENPERRLDRGDQGPVIVGAVRAYDRGDRDRLRDLYTVAGRPAPPALSERRANRQILGRSL